MPNGYDRVVPEGCLGQAWFKIPGMDERGAGGRLVIAPSTLCRPDLEYNYEIVALAIKHFGSRPSVYPLRDEVQNFFYLSRPRGKRPVSSVPTCMETASWLLSDGLCGVMAWPPVLTFI